jgi:hypothetical protein
MKPQKSAVVALLVLATCTQGSQSDNGSNVESPKVKLGQVPASEVAVWQKVGSSTSPDARYLQASAFDEARKVVVVFGGISYDMSMGTGSVSQDTWEWNPATSKWTRRTLDGAKPDARSGAAMAYDSARAKFILFGGRAGSGYNLEDTWEWDPATGAWTDVGPTGGHPSARAQHSMVFEKSTGKVLLFGGGRSTPTSNDGTGVTISLGDTWEYDPVAKTWAARTVTASPSVRNDSALVWDATRKRAILFGGIQVDIAGAPGVPKQDTWEWDPEAGTWTEKAASGTRPSQRYGHAMAFDATGNKVVLYGGWDMGNGMVKSDVWDWDPAGAWKQRLTGTEAGAPTGRMYAAMVSDDARDRMIIVGGASSAQSGGVVVGGAGGSVAITSDAAVAMADMMFSPYASREIWELDPVTPAWSDKTPPLDAPTSRQSPAMAFNPLTGKTCLFGGGDTFSGQLLNDYWEWDGKTWTQVQKNAAPDPRIYSAMAFDPARKSMILFGGVGNTSGAYSDTWELTSDGKWIKLSPAKSPGGLMGPSMTTDTTRKKILLFGGTLIYDYSKDPNPVPYPDPSQNAVWEWDGATMTWTDRSPPDTTNVAHRQQNPAIAYDEARQKLFLYEGTNWGNMPSSFYEWDPVTAGWALRDTGDGLNYGYNYYAVYDSQRRREVILTGANSSMGSQEVWELDSVGPTWYVREMSTGPGMHYGSAMVFDSVRGVVVFFGGNNGIYGVNVPADTWEYKVTGWGNGEGCTAATASQCASGFCVDGVCCNVAACTGACKSCNVAGSEGTCVLVKAGTEVAGSCDSGKACDGTGTCKTKNSTACTSGAECASGFCVDGVCCDSACDGACVSCNQEGRVGKCTPYQAGTDPQTECGNGTGACKSTCDGVGNCAYPQYTVKCGDCLNCDGYGSCSSYDYTCSYPYTGGPYPVGGYYGGSGGYYYGSGGYYGGSGGYYYGSGGYYGGSGGVGGYARGGAGGGITIVFDGGPRPQGGSGGIIPGIDGSAGSIARYDGAAGNTPGAGGNAGAPGIDGAAGNTPFNDGSAGNIPGVGGSGGAGYGLGGIDGGLPAVGGAGGSNLTGSGGRVGGPDAGVKTNLNSGCSCEVGQSQSGGAGLGSLASLLGLSLLLVRRRRLSR